MDAFARLRQRIYLERSGDPLQDARHSISELGQALLGNAAVDPAIRATLLAAALRRSDDPRPVLELLPQTGTNLYFDRYLADALYEHPAAHEQANSIVAELTREAKDLLPFERLLTGAGVRTGPAGTDRTDLPDRTKEPARTDGPIRADIPPPDETARGDGALDHPVALVQCMFHGDPARSGRGNSGGIATLLRDLGSTMSDEVGGVATLVHYNECTATYPFREVEPVSPTHSIVRMRLGLPEESARGFLAGRNDLRRAFARVVNRFGLANSIFHVRFLDDASLEVARQTVRMGGRLVATITPDPHRRICGEDGEIRAFDIGTGLEILNKVLIGDELVERAHGILAIGRDTIQKTLLDYYPQLEDTRGRSMTGIDEGVRIVADGGDPDLDRLFTRTAPEHRLAPDMLGRPAILCVGRLAEVKNQVALVEAWSRGAHQTHNLILIGGDLENPSAEEADLITRIRSVVDGRQELRGGFCHLPGTPNATVRQIQVALANRDSAGGPDLYVCPSLKEEFGLSILEAMAAGMIVCAPINGGAGTYIRHGVNGFLIDTRTALTIAAELAATGLDPALRGDRAERIRANARETVAAGYSMERIAARFARFYAGVQCA